MDIAISLIGGLGMFLYGMNVMGDGLQKAAGEKLKKIIEMLTTNRIMGVLVGTLVTAIIQSSSATTVMTIGFVNAGIMSLQQAVGVIMGANIGTTVTAQLVSFNIEKYAPIAIGIGMVFWFFTKKKNIKNISEILIGFGILFVGMNFMKEAAAPVSEMSQVHDAMLYLSKNPVLGILAGFLITGTIQSSSASIGILIVLASQGLLPITAALPVLYGDNIGTCVTSLLSTIGASRNARRAAIMHLCFNVIGTLLFIIVLSKPIVALVTSIDPTNVPRQIANAHTLFNVVNVIVLLPFSTYLVKLATKLVPYTEDEELENIHTTKFLDERILETPSIALSNTVDEVIRMASRSTRSLNSAYDAVKTFSHEKREKTFEYERMINTLQLDITNYLFALSNRNLSDIERIKADVLFHIVNDIERVGDHADNIAEISQFMEDKKVIFTEDARNELDTIFELASKNFYDSITALKTSDFELAATITEREREINILEQNARNSHMARLHAGTCSVEAGIYFLDIISNLERISDHSINITEELGRMSGHVSL
ncbi:MAG: Na/Pi cotransporter family protein [Peptostreptococcus sp.]|jgi:Na/Pi-cotransporter II-like protein|uniref:Na/Pi cotransporter family protein n=1 Tax=Peptostreptococcus TaxID=1257 RepID=UPI001CAC53A1|nr:MULTISPECIES: Na/Pi cotransporter family protein [Peptostreptococcus]MBF1048551.1 Na/Pi cotransporter family protein [Peptostreptococcus sp.]MBF1049966.1 Na/Pi cotransporter family protein [Peptostreptococcus sp.]MBF1052606.1 Na/Pi cotransporter family protein [Peptostreptococcus sp.]MBF1057286.1 Na/Pi cotransporter family protein [Peptostreptococcus sp.]